MPNIWDNDKIVPNLQVIASLTSKKQGRKLDVDNENGTLSAYEPVTIGVEFIRRWSSPSVSDQERFQKPIQKLFKAAYQNGVNHDLIANAIRGLRAMRESYEDEKRKAVDALLLKILPKGLKTFHKTWPANTRLQFAQAYFLGQEGEGICMGLTFDWVAKRLENDQYTPTLTGLLDHFEKLKGLQENRGSCTKVWRSACRDCPRWPAAGTFTARPSSRSAAARK